MNKKDAALKILLEQKLLPLFYHDNPETSLETLLALYDAGVRTVEYTNRGGEAFKNFKVLRKAADKTMEGLLLGIGTIKNEDDAKDFIDAGADFVVCPTMNKKVGKAVHQEKLLWIPGCMTATEIGEAELCGATIVKIFPGNVLGPKYITAVRDIFPGLKFIPTGGVEAEEGNLKEWFQSGVCAVGMGSKLISKQILEQKDFERLKRDTRKALELVANAANTI